MKTIYVIRHAPAGEGGRLKLEDDERRALTDRGRKVARNMARALHGLGVRLDLVLASPLRRASQTAALVVQQYEALDRLIVTESLLPDVPIPLLLKEVRRHLKTADSIALVGHNPQLARLVSVLVSGAEGANIELQKGGVCRLDFERLKAGKCATLAGLLNPAGL